MNIGGEESPDTCSQICLPVAFWGPAEKRGVTHGHCKDNGCRTFKAAEKFAGVPYNVYECDCPATNASALYTCPGQQDAGGGGFEGEGGGEGGGTGPGKGAGDADSEPGSVDDSGEGACGLEPKWEDIF